jgi:hypothetical protein
MLKGHKFKKDQNVYSQVYGAGKVVYAGVNSHGENYYDVNFENYPGQTLTAMEDSLLLMHSAKFKLGEAPSIMDVLNAMTKEPTNDTTTKEETCMAGVVIPLKTDLRKVSDASGKVMTPEEFMEEAKKAKSDELSKHIIDGGSIGLKDEAFGKRARKITLDNEGNPAGGAVFANGTMTPGALIGKHNPTIKEVPSNVKRHYDIVMGLNELYAKKNADYGDSFHDTYVEEGMAMARIRLSDKLNRFKSLTKSGNQQVNDESVRDTLLDLANYAIMTVIEMDREEAARA